jgi:hypothetical protein
MFFFNWLFFSRPFMFEEEGFGSVFDGYFRGGQLEEVSTQAVLDLFKNVNEGGSNSTVIEIGVDEVDKFHLPGVIEADGTVVSETVDVREGIAVPQNEQIPEIGEDGELNHCNFLCAV